MSTTEQAHKEAKYLQSLQQWVSSEHGGNLAAADELIDFTLNRKVLNGDEYTGKLFALEHVLATVREKPVEEKALGAMVQIAITTDETPARSPWLTGSGILRAAKAIAKTYDQWETWTHEPGPKLEAERREEQLRLDRTAALLNPLFRAAIENFDASNLNADPKDTHTYRPEHLVTSVISAMPVVTGQQAAALHVWSDHLVAIAVDDPKTVGRVLRNTARSANASQTVVDFCNEELAQGTHDKAGLRFLNTMLNGALRDDSVCSIAAHADALYYRDHAPVLMPDTQHDALAEWEDTFTRPKLPALVETDFTSGSGAAALKFLMDRRAEPAPVSRFKGSGGY